MKSKYLFEVPTPIGISIRTTNNYWKLIQLKHPEIKGHLLSIKELLKMPDLITRSKIDNSVLLFYKKLNGYWLCTVTKHLDISGYLITVYITDRIKEGIKIWPN